MVFMVEKQTTKFLPTRQYHIVPVCGLEYHNHEIFSTNWPKIHCSRKFYPSKNTRYTVLYMYIHIHTVHINVQAKVLHVHITMWNMHVLYVLAEGPESTVTAEIESCVPPTYSSLLTTHHSLLTPYHSPLTTYPSPLTPHHSPLTTHHSSPLTTHHSPLTTHHPPFTPHRSPPPHHSPLTPHPLHSPLTTLSSPLTTHSSPLTTPSPLTTHSSQEYDLNKDGMISYREFEMVREHNHTQDCMSVHRTLCNG